MLGGERSASPSGHGGMSKKFNVEVREVHVALHEVEAASLEEAMKLVKDGKTSATIVEYSHTLGEGTWSVTDDDGNVLKDQE